MLNKYLNITITNVKITIIKRDQEKNFPRIILVLFINSKYEFKYWSNFIDKKKIKIIGLPIFYGIKKRNNFYKKI